VGNRRTLIAAAAMILAAVAGIGVYFYVSSADKRAQQNVTVVDAFVASQDIPKGTTGENAVASGLITPAKVLRGSVPPAAVTDTSFLKGKVAASTIGARQFITGTSFVAPSQGGGGSLAAAIGTQGLVAVTVSVDAAHGVADGIAPGDHVDIAVAGDAGATYLLTGVRVLAVGQETAASAGGGNGQPSTSAANSGLITFEVSPADALRVVAANRSGSLYLTLESLGTTTGNTPAVPASGH
jgi:Flp pilus assembly protein CpaB